MLGTTKNYINPALQKLRSGCESLKELLRGGEGAKIWIDLPVYCSVFIPMDKISRLVDEENFDEVFKSIDENVGAAAEKRANEGRHGFYSYV